MVIYKYNVHKWLPQKKIKHYLAITIYNLLPKEQAICSRDYDVTLGGIAHKAGTYTELKASHFLND